MKKVIGRDVLYRVERIEPVARTNNTGKESEFKKLLDSLRQVKNYNKNIRRTK